MNIARTKAMPDYRAFFRRPSTKKVAISNIKIANSQGLMASIIAVPNTDSHVS